MSFQNAEDGFGSAQCFGLFQKHYWKASEERLLGESCISDHRHQSSIQPDLEQSDSPLWIRRLIPKVAASGEISLVLTGSIRDSQPNHFLTNQ
jgi:hypothetical protein